MSHVYLLVTILIETYFKVLKQYNLLPTSLICRPSIIYIYDERYMTIPCHTDLLALYWALNTDTKCYITLILNAI